MKRWILLATLVLACPGVSAAPDDARGEKLKELLPRGGWEVGDPKNSLEDSSYFEQKGRYCLIKTTASQEAARDIAVFVDRYLVEFSKIFKGAFKIKPPLTMRVFTHVEEFVEFYQKTYRTQHEPRTALYAVHIKETWVCLKQGSDGRKELPVETTKHEFTHHMLHYFTGQARIPDWFNEGAACFFQYWNVGDSNKVNIKQNLIRARTGHYGYFPRVIKEEFGGQDFLTPERLIGLSYRAFHTKDPRLERLYYSQSWALVNFLASTKDGKRYMGKILKELRKDEPDLKKLFKKETLEKLERAWYRDIQRRVVPAA